MLGNGEGTADGTSTSARKSSGIRRMKETLRGKTTRGKSEEKAESLSFFVTESVKEDDDEEEEGTNKMRIGRLLPNKDSNHK